jgi:hypothetical protein
VAGQHSGTLIYILRPFLANLLFCDDILSMFVFQARAPNSPVLIVGTHFDMVRDYFPPAMSEDLQQIIRDK